MSVETDTGVDGAEDTTLRDELRATIEAIEAREAASPADTPTHVDPADELAVAAAARADGRDEQGRFAGKPKDAADAAQATDAPAADAAAAAVAAAPDAAATAELAEPPSSWKANEKAAWAGMSPEARSAVMRRERDVAEMSGRLDNERQFGREFADIIQPHYETIQRFGVTPQFAVKTLLGNDHVLRYGKPEEKVALARRMIREYGLDPAVIAQPDPNVPSDPHVLALQSQIATMQARLAGQNAAPMPTAPALLQPPAQDGNVVSQIEAFRSDPAHPHFDKVIDRMIALVDSGTAANLDDAYDQAVWADPTLRASLLAAQSAPPAVPAPSAVTVATAAAASKTAAARHAGASVSGSPGAGGTAKPATLRDELREQLRAHGYS